MSLPANTNLAVPAGMTCVPEKRSFYAVDAYFREGWEDLLILGSKDAEWFCHTHSLVLLKPDAVVARRLVPALRWLGAHGFTIVDAALVTMSRHSIRALWHFGWNAASRDRRDAADLYVTAGDCLLLLVTAPDCEEQPTSLVLSRAKGPPEPHLCRPGQLRYELGSVNYQLNFVHAPDEPADLVRELAVLCGHTIRDRFYGRAQDRHHAAQEAYDLVRSLEAANPPERLDLEHVLDAIAATAATTLRAGSAALEQVYQQLRALREATSRSWKPLLHMLHDNAVPVTTWQQITLATSLLDPHIPDAAPLLPDLSRGPGRDT